MSSGAPYRSCADSRRNIAKTFNKTFSTTLYSLFALPCGLFQHKKLTFRFKKCLYKACKATARNEFLALNAKACRAKAKLAFLAVMGVGCQPYKDAQVRRCLHNQ